MIICDKDNPTIINKYWVIPIDYIETSIEQKKRNRYKRIQKWIDRCLKGESYESIAKDYNLKPSSIYYAIREYEVKTNKYLVTVDKNYLKKRNKEIFKMYSDGVYYKTIAKKFNLTGTSIQSIIRKFKKNNKST